MTNRDEAMNLVISLLAQERFNKSVDRLTASELMEVIELITPKSASSKLHAKRKWWAREILVSLEDIAGPERSQRGRYYYKNGYVRKGAKVTAVGLEGRVRGSSRGSYAVQLVFVQWSDEDVLFLAKEIAQNSSYYLAFSEGVLADELEPLVAPSGEPYFRAGESASIYCNCWDYQECKHGVALAHELAGRVETDMGLYFSLYGVSLRDFTKTIHQIRATSNVVEVPDDFGAKTRDEFGWPIAEEPARITSVKFYGSSPQKQTRSKILADHGTTVRIRLDVATLLPKNRLTGQFGPFTDWVQTLYDTLDEIDAIDYDLDIDPGVHK